MRVETMLDRSEKLKRIEGYLQSVMRGKRDGEETKNR
jgi:hypothetical protein